MLAITTPEAALSKTDALYRQLSARRPEVRRFNEFFRGEQPLAYASKEWREFNTGRFDKFSDNWCGVVGNSPSERTRVNGFRVGDSVDAITADEKQLQRDWLVNEMDAQSSQGFLQSIIAKRSNVLVWGDDDDEPVMTWESPDQTIVEHYPSLPRVRRAARKAWMSDDCEYATLYLADALWKWKRPRGLVVGADGRTVGGLFIPYSAGGVGGGGWVPRDDEGEPWPLPNPMRIVPMVEFPNRPMLGGEPISDIEGTIAMQNAINLLWNYLFSAADFASLPARVVMGQSPPKIPILDTDGRKIGEKPVEAEALTKGRMLWLTGESTTIGQWDAAKLDVFTDVINRGVRHLAAQTRTPVHYIVGELNNVNGETLLAGETGLVKKVEESQLFYSPAVREVKRLNALVRGNKGLAEACRTGTVMWADPATRTTAQASDAALKDRQVGLSLQTTLERRYGMTQQEIQQELDRIRAEQSDPQFERVMRELKTGGTPSAALA